MHTKLSINAVVHVALFAKKNFPVLCCHLKYTSSKLQFERQHYWFNVATKSKSRHFEQLLREMEGRTIFKVYVHKVRKCIAVCIFGFSDLEDKPCIPNENDAWGILTATYTQYFCKMTLQFLPTARNSNNSNRDIDSGSEFALKEALHEEIYCRVISKHRYH